MVRSVGIILVVALLIAVGSPTLGQADNAQVYAGEPFNIQGRVNFISWSPDGTTAAYWVYPEVPPATNQEGSQSYLLPGELWFLRVETGETCRYPEPYRSPIDLNFQPTYSNRTTNTWLPDSRILVLQEGALVASTPCADDFTPVTLPDGTPVHAGSLDGWSPDYSRLLLDGGAAIYTFNPPALARVTDFKPDPYGAWSWSLDSRHIAVSLSGPGSTYVIDTQTAEVRLLLEEPIESSSDSVLGIFPHLPIWLSPTQVIVSTTSWKRVIANLEDGFIDVNPEIIEVEPHSGAPIDGTDAYHLAFRLTGRQPNYLYHSETGTLEELDQVVDGFSPDGRWLALTGIGGSGIYLRPVDPPGSETVALVPPGLASNVTNPGHSQWSPDWSKVAVTNENGVSIVSVPDGEILQSWDTEDCDDYRLDGWSPDETRVLLRLYGTGCPTVGAVVMIDTD